MKIVLIKILTGAASFCGLLYSLPKDYSFHLSQFVADHRLWKQGHERRRIFSHTDDALLFTLFGLFAFENGTI